MNLVVFLFIIHLVTHHFELLSFHFLLEFFVQLPPALVISSVVDEDAAVPKIAPPRLVEILAALRIVVHSRGVANKCWCSHRT